MSVKDLEESLLDYASQASAELQESLSLVSTNEQKDALILEHIKKLSCSERPSILDPNEKVVWVSGLKDQSLASYCAKHLALLDFFTYCCINCQHVIPDLKDLENIYTPDDGFVVVGVHSAKFETEREPENVRRAGARMAVTHPILNDPHAQLWNRLGIHCWPTLVLLDPEGRPILVLAGEGHRDLLFRCVSVAITHFRENQTLSKATIPLTFSKNHDMSFLQFPGKVSLNEFTSGKPGESFLTVSDSGNNRIVITDMLKKIIHIIGGLDAGFKDGNFSDARFSNPQGSCWLDIDTLIVCDTGNHAIRKISISKKTVELMAGTGVLTEFGDQGGLKYCQQSISSPWDIILYKTPDMDMSLRSPLLKSTEKCDLEKEIKEKEDSSPVDELRRVLLIASAGCHQIWALFLDTVVWWKYRTYAEGTLISIVGSGREENRNNRYPNAAGLAQPSGLTLSENTLYIADSESSTVRKLDLTSGHLHAFVGGDRNPCNLFAFGDIDGVGYSARLQHPLGVAYSSKNSSVYIADSYNHKIKIVDSSTCECTVFYPMSNCRYHLSEPSGIVISENLNLAFVADTNNHRVVSINLDTKKCDMCKLFLPVEFKTEEKFCDFKGKDLIQCTQLINICLKKGTKLILNLDCETEKGGKDLHLTPQAPQRWNVKFFQSNAPEIDMITDWDVAGCIRSGKDLPGRFEASLKETYSDTVRVLRVEFFLSLCEGGTCFVRRFAVDFTIVFTGSTKRVLKYNLKTIINPKKEILVNIQEFN